MKPNIIIAFPTRGNDIGSGLVSWLLYHTDHYVLMSKSPLSARIAQEELFRRVATDACKCDYAFFLDTDIVPERDAIVKMVAHNKDIITAPVWHYDENTKDIHIGVHYDFEYKRHHLLKTGVEQIKAASFSATLVSRKVLDTFMNAKESPVRWSPLLDEEHKETAPHNDNIFYLKAYRLGLEAWIDWDIKIEHNRRVTLSSEVINNLVGGVLHEYSEINKRFIKDNTEATGKREV